ISLWIPSAEKSLEYVLAARCPRNVRRPMARDPDSFSVSTSPIRTTGENSEPSRTTASAAVAPAFIARETTLAASSRSSVSTSVIVCVFVAIILRCPPRSCCPASAWECQPPPAPTVHLYRKCQRLHQAQDR